MEYSEKTDANYIQNTVNVALAREYSIVGDLKKADTYFEKMCELSPETSTLSLKWQAAFTKGIYLTAKGRWEEANQVFKEMREQREQALKEHAQKGFVNTTWVGIFSSQMVAWALEKQGLLEAASVPRERASEHHRTVSTARLRRSLGTTSVQLNLMMPRRVQVGEEFVDTF